MSENFYAVLGVAEDATQAEIKAAYRAIARKYHPDRNPGDAEAESIFKDAAEAYRVLGDNDLREQYDMHRGQGGPDGLPQMETASEVIDELFGSRGAGGRSSRGSSARGTRARSRAAPEPPRERPPSARRGPERGDDLRYTLDIDLEEAAHGAERDITIAAPGRCSVCGGTGAEPGSSPVICQTCGGSGSMRLEQGFFNSVQRCTDCRGAGRLIPRDCYACHGSGVREGERRISIHVPPGVDSGTRLKVSAEGMPGTGGAASGDLFVVINVREHPLFEREERDVVTEVPISFVRATLGGEIEIPTLEGRMVMRVPPGSQSGRIFRLKGRGLPSLDGKARGDQRVRIVVDVPAELDDEQRRLLERFERIESARPGRGRVAEYMTLLGRYFG